MDSTLVSAYEKIASGHRQLAEYYASLASTSSSAEVAPTSEEAPITQPEQVLQSPKSPKTPRVKKPKDPHAPKRPMSSFLLFSNEHRAALKEKHPEMSYQDITRELGNLWKTADHKSYDERYLAMRDDYKTKNEAYQKIKADQPEGDAKAPEKKERKKKAKKTEISPEAVLEETTTETFPEEEKAVEESPRPTVPVPQVETEAEPSQQEEKKDKKKKKKAKHSEESSNEQTLVTPPASDDFIPTEPKVKKQKMARESKEEAIGQH